MFQFQTGQLYGIIRKYLEFICDDVACLSFDYFQNFKWVFVKELSELPGVYIWRDLEHVLLAREKFDWIRVRTGKESQVLLDHWSVDLNRSLE